MKLSYRLTISFALIFVCIIVFSKTNLLETSKSITPKVNLLTSDFLQLTTKEFENRYYKENLHNIGVIHNFGHDDQKRKWDFNVSPNFLKYGYKFKGNIVENIRIGDSIDKVEAVLGKPQFNDLDLGLIGYKYHDFYVSFFGSERIKEISIAKKYDMPSKYDSMVKDILDNQFSAAEVESHYPQYYNDLYYMYGRRLHYSNGVTFNYTNYITVYSNYEGEIMKDDERIYFIDEDLYFTREKQYYAVEKSFEREAEKSTSPNGNISLVVIKSDDVRGFDYGAFKYNDDSFPPFVISLDERVLGINDFHWLDNRYVLFDNYNFVSIIDVENKSVVGIDEILPMPYRNYRGLDFKSQVIDQNLFYLYMNGYDDDKLFVYAEYAADGYISLSLDKQKDAN